MKWALFVFLVACTPVPEPAPSPALEPGVVRRTTQSGYYEVDVKFKPEKPGLGELFEVEAVARTRDGLPLEVGKVLLNARMPQHNHGMETDPVHSPGECDAAGTACTHPGGRYLSQGFKFHMPGEWTVTIEVTGPRGTDTTSYVYEMK